MADVSSKVMSIFASVVILLAAGAIKSFVGPVNAVFFPARICFNSMASSFQSECVFCDSRLYASTLTACTGSPTLPANVTQAQAFCIATACLQQTGKTPIMLGRRRRRRAIQLRPLNFSLDKTKGSYLWQQGKNGTLVGQFNKLTNGTTSGNVAFVLNNPKAGYLWSNPLTRVLIRNTPTKNLQWQFGVGQPAATRAASASTAAAPTGGGVAAPPAKQPAATGQSSAIPQLASRPSSSQQQVSPQQLLPLVQASPRFAS